METNKDGKNLFETLSEKDLGPFGIHAQKHIDDFLRQEKEREKENRKDFVKNLPSYIAQIFKAFLELFIILGIFSSASNGFETIVFSLLIGIYILINFFLMLWRFANVFNNIALANEIRTLKVLVGQEEDVDQKAKSDEHSKVVNKLRGVNKIKTVSYVIFTLVVLLNLISVL